MLSRIKLTYEAVSAVVANDGHRIIGIDDVSQLNVKSVEGLCWFLLSPGGNTGGVSNPGVVVSAMSEANLQGMIYHNKVIKRIGSTCTHANVELAKVREMYNQQDMDEAQRDPEVVPTVNPKYWPNTLETVEEYIRGF